MFFFQSRSNTLKEAQNVFRRTGQLGQQYTLLFNAHIDNINRDIDSIAMILI